MNHVVKNKTLAKKQAANQLRNELNKKRLPNLCFETVNGRCSCGETPAIKAISFTNKSYDAIIVSYCENCYTDYE